MIVFPENFNTSTHKKRLKFKKLCSKKNLGESWTKHLPDMNSTIKTEFLEIFNIFFENFVITVISFGKVAENFSSSENCLSSYGVDFILEPLQRANYALQCGSYDEMADFRHFFPNLIRHISTPMTSW